MQKSQRLLYLLLLIGLLPACQARPQPAVSETAPPAETAAPVKTGAADCAGFEGVSQPPEGKYLFVELWVKKEGTGGTIDRPQYDFKPRTKVLRPYRSKEQFPFDVTDWGMVGKGENIEGGGSAGHLTIISTLPFSTTIPVFTGNTITYLAGQPNEYLVEEMIEFPVVFLAASADGALAVEINSRLVVLAAGENWSRVVEIDVLEDHTTRHYRIVSSLTNYGWLERSQIELRP
jgi:hypothetical protein